MESTFLNNNEQIIEDLANLEAEQEQQIFKIIFDTFKVSPRVVEFNDICILGKALGHKTDDIDEFWKQVWENFEGFLDFNQFCEFLQKLDPTFTPKEQNNNMEGGQPEEEKKLEETIENKEKAKGEEEEVNISKNEEQKEENKSVKAEGENNQPPLLADYKDNAIVPSNGVALTPDSRVVKMIKQLNTFFRNWEKEKEFGDAKIVKHKIEVLKKKELKRQKDYLRANQEKELISIENSQKMQFYEFSQAWDTFMSDYEATAYLSLEKLKERHAKEMAEFQKNFRDNLESKIKFSKKVYDLRRRVEVLINMRNYEEADKYKMFLSKLEEEERGQLIKALKKNSHQKEK